MSQWCRTMFGNIQPHTILIKGVLIRIEPVETPATIRGVPVHRRVLLMAENYSFARTTFSATFATL